VNKPDDLLADLLPGWAVAGAGAGDGFHRE
jgi:hypothetical protein